MSDMLGWLVAYIRLRSWNISTFFNGQAEYALTIKILYFKKCLVSIHII